MSNRLIQKLIPGDLRTTGKADEVAREIVTKPELIPDILTAIESDNPGLRMRAADALEKAASQTPKIIQPHTKHIQKLAMNATQQEVQWHMAQLLSYLELSKTEQTKVSDILFNYIETTQSNIVKAFSAETLLKIAQNNSGLNSKIHEGIKKLYQTGSPCVRKKIKKYI